MVGRTIAVVGAGIVGAAVAAALATDGHRVAVFEQGEPGGGVSGGSLACLTAHMIDVEELELLSWCCDAWRTEGESGIEYRACGQLRFFFTPVERASAERWVEVERGHGLRRELLDRNAVRAIEPRLEGPVAGATWSPDDATVNPFLAVRAYLARARAHGATIHTRTPVRAVTTRGNAVSGIRTDDATFDAQAVVVAGGPWTAALLASVGVSLPIVARKAQCLATTAQPPTIRTVVGACKADGGVDDGYTQIQQSEHGQILFNTVLGAARDDASPEAVPEIDRPFMRSSVEMLLRLFPSLREVPVLRSWVRYEAVTPDDRFAIGRAGPDGLIVAAGDAGTGFVRAPAIGRIIADLFAERTSPFPTSLYDPARFASA